jgi:hypothetical protein
MKKLVTIAFSMLLLCGLLLVGIAKAGNTDYSFLEYWAQVPATVDGEWTSTDEWTDAPRINMSDNAYFKYKMNSDTMGMEWIVEIFTDDTDDAGDIWQICIDFDNSGGSAPTSDCYMIEIEGHTTLTVYAGDGSGWTEVTPDIDEITWDDSINASPKNATPHWILEVVDNSKESGAVQAGQPPNGMRAAAYDADTETWVSWAPDSSEDVPDEWGVVENYSMDPYIPEAFSIGVVVLLSSVAVAVGFYFVRKRPKLKALL